MGDDGDYYECPKCGYLSETEAERAQHACPTVPQPDAPCPHDYTEREAAIADGMCALCLAARLEALTRQVAYLEGLCRADETLHKLVAAEEQVEALTREVADAREQWNLAHLQAEAAEARIASLESELEASNNAHNATGRFLAEMGERAVRAETGLSDLWREADRRRDRIRELEAALRDVEPYLDAILCYASTAGEYGPNYIVKRVRAVIEKSSEPTPDPNPSDQGRRAIGREQAQQLVNQMYAILEHSSQSATRAHQLLGQIEDLLLSDDESL